MYGSGWTFNHTAILADERDSAGAEQVFHHTFSPSRWGVEGSGCVQTNSLDHFSLFASN